MLNRFFVLMLFFSMCGSEQLSATRFVTQLVGAPITLKKEIDVPGRLDARGFPDKKGCIVDHWFSMQNRFGKEPSSDESSDGEDEIVREVTRINAIGHIKRAAAKRAENPEIKKRSAFDQVVPEAGAKKQRMTIEELPHEQRRLPGKKTAFNIAGKTRRITILRTKGKKILAQAPQLGAVREDDMPPLEEVRPRLRSAFVRPLMPAQTPLTVLASVAAEQEERRPAVMAVAQASVSANYDSVD
jgi:hypothetical protein